MRNVEPRMESDKHFEDPSALALTAEASTLLILQHLAQAAEVPFDETKARRALRKAERDIPPTATRAARRRLHQAAQELGLQLLSCQLSAREAIKSVDPETVLAIFTVSSEGTARWHLLVERNGGKARLAHLQAGDTDEWLDPDALAERIGAADADVVVEWLVAQPATPMAEFVAPEEQHLPILHHEHHGIPPLQRLLGLIQPDRRDLVLVVIYAIAIGLLSLATPITLMAVVNTVALATLVQQLIVLCLGLLVCLGLVALLRVLQTIVVEYIQRRIFARVAADLAYRLPRVRQAAFDRQHGPELVNRFFDVMTAQKASAILLLDGVDVILQTLIGLALLATYHYVLLGFNLALLAALAFMVWPLGRGAVITAIRTSRAKYAVVSWLQEMARHPAAFKIGGGPSFALEQTDVLTRQFLLARHKHFRILMRQFSFALGVYALTTTALLALGGYLVIAGQLTLGQLVAAELVVSLVVVSLTKLSKHMEMFYGLLAAVEKLGHLLDLPLERQDGAAHQMHTKGAAVYIHNISFSYDHGHQPVLEHFSLTLEPGERVALLGPNGSGKSTLVDLLFGLRTPTHGYIEIDGIDIRDLQLESLREHVAIVKGVEIVEGTILDNIRMGREEISITDVQRTLVAVGLQDDVHDLPEGLHTRLWAGGSPLSLGQAERLMLARAIVGQPRLLVIDELLDNMDHESHAQVLPVIFNRDARWTLLVITHNLEIAKQCDRQIRFSRHRPPEILTLGNGDKSALTN